MAKYPNFYENLTEANSRLSGTIVLYDGEPVYINSITNHLGDGQFRLYIVPVEEVPNGPTNNPMNNIGGNHPQLGHAMDAWLAANPNYKMLRKKMDSKKFNNFRPFPLGMLNPGVPGTKAQYLERQPARPRMEQGLTPSMVVCTFVELETSSSTRSSAIASLYTEAFKECVLGKYPSPREALLGLANDKFATKSVAFHREFAFVKGPVGTIFLGYKTDVIGILPSGDLDSLVLSKEFIHAKEAVEDLSLFYKINVR